MVISTTYGAHEMTAIVVENLTKRYRDTVAVHDLSFKVRSGTVTGLLGRNGAGKTTTLRTMLGLVRPNFGRVLIEGREYAQLDKPWATVGAVLEHSGFHPGRTAREHLNWIAATARLPSARVGELLEVMELSADADRKVGNFSFGMRQRLALAAAMIGNPSLLILDEPANGLDPQGIKWLRDLMRSMAEAGSTVFVSSHVLAEVSEFADDVVVIDRGQLVLRGSIDELTTRSAVRVHTPDSNRLVEAVSREAETVHLKEQDVVYIEGLALSRVAEIAAAAGVAIYEIAQERETLENLFLRVTRQEHT